MVRGHDMSLLKYRMGSHQDMMGDVTFRTGYVGTYSKD